MKILSFLPKAYLSWCVGRLVYLRLPGPLAKLSVQIFARMYGIDTDAATKSLSEYSSIGDFFVRDLRPELRPIGDGIVCPVDGTLRCYEDVSSSGQLTQVKGREYSLESLLGGGECAERFKGGQLWNFYLSPTDAHHIFSPVAGSIVETVHVPGALWPVNDWALNAIDGLFVKNERIVAFIESEFGMVAVVMVGATNVGRISLSYSSLETNVAPWIAKKLTRIPHSEPISIDKGGKLGTFHMGSSVLLVTERRLFDLAKRGAASSPLGDSQPCKTRYGEPLERYLSRTM
jgi:phosphatidylserine decarboxylase